MYKFKTLSVVLFAFLLLPFVAKSQQLQTVPDISLQTTDGNTVKLRSYLSNGALQIAFWALWCEPCKQELKVMTHVFDSLQAKGYMLVAISEDNQKSMAKVRSYAASQGWKFPVLLDPNGDALRRMNGQNIPFSLIADKDGKIHAAHIGYIAGDEIPVKREIMELLDQHTANPAGGTGK